MWAEAARHHPLCRALRALVLSSHARPSCPLLLLQFAAADYAADVAWMAGRSPEEVVATLRRGAVGFAR